MAILRGLYTSASGMIAHQRRLDVVANNLANVNTPGFQRDRAVVAPFAELLIHRTGGRALPAPVGALGTGAGIAAVVPDFSVGQAYETGQATDLALMGPGFFAVQAEDGAVLYTRRGQFRLDEEGYLTTPEGWRLLGEDGPIRVPSADFQVTEEGVVMAGDVPIARIAVVAFGDPAGLERRGQSLYAATAASGPAVPAQPPIRQGYLERANVDVASEVVEMISAFRAYEANQRLIQVQDALLDRAANEIGRV